MSFGELSRETLSFAIEQKMNVVLLVIIDLLAFKLASFRKTKGCEHFVHEVAVGAGEFRKFDTTKPKIVVAHRLSPKSISQKCLADTLTSSNKGMVDLDQIQHFVHKNNPPNTGNSALHFL